MIGLEAPVAVMPPGTDVTVYPVIALPPLDAGAVKLTVACALPPTAVTAVGAPGAVAIGVMLLDATDAAPLPKAFMAVTVNAYAIPLVRPGTMIGLAPPMAVIFPGAEVTMYTMIGSPPLAAGGVKLTVA
jgi:hypothetical protein